MMPAKTGRYGELSLGGLAAQECWNVQVVAGNFAGDFADVFLDLLNDVAMESRFGACCRSHSCWSSVPFFAARFPRTRHELRALRCIFLVGFLEARGDNGNFHRILHRFVLHRAENNVGVFRRGFLNDGRRFVNFVQRKARAAANVDENSLRALNRIVLEQRTGDGAIRGVDRTIRSGRRTQSWPVPAETRPGRAAGRSCYAF